MTLKEDIKKQRPKLSEGSLNTYASLLKSLYNKVFESKDVDIERFNKDDDKIIKHLEDEFVSIDSFKDVVVDKNIIEK